MITAPSLDQVDQWVNMLEHRSDLKVFTAIAQWGADQELEACREWVSKYLPYFGSFPMPEDKLLAARRPELPSLKEQALEALDRMDQFPNIEDRLIVLRALEALPE
jgi:hypothetical protein